MSDYPKNPATALTTAVARSVDQCFDDVVMLVDRNPHTQLTETQRTQLRVVLGMYGRAIASQGRWYERQRHNLGVATTVISPRLVLRETQPHQSVRAPLPAPPRTTDEDPRYPDDATTKPMRRPIPDLGDE